ncbi:MAG: hypothetical protein QG602_2085 [Verrucomicrobiota bacterium]|nr:hypothetical protein [Verrucomicrobiota bacterium]
MKAFLPVLLASLAVNAALGALLLRKPAAPARPAAAATAVAQTASPAATQNAANPVNAPVTSVAATPAARAPLWAGLGPESFDEAIVRLRAAGCTPREIAAALRAMINELIQSQYQDLGQASTPYWKSPSGLNPARPRNEFMEMAVRHQQLIRTYLLTPELFGTDESELRTYRERFGALDTEKLRRLAILESEQGERSMQLSMATGSTKPGDSVYNENLRKQHDQIQKERETAIQAILTPEEYAQFEVRNGPVAMGLRFQLENFRPTEAEYLALYAIEKSRRQTADPGALTPQQRKEASDSYQAAIQAALTPERFADYEAVRKAGSDLLPRLINRLNLPLTTLPAVTAVRDDTNARAKAIRDNATLSADQRAAQLTALAAEAEADLRTLFVTPRGLDAYKDMKGEWLRSLSKP